MLRRSINSALFIDYENVGRNKLANTIPNWLGWLEEGEFNEEKKRRHFIEKRVYLNPAEERLKPTFEQFGFDVVVCDRFTALKNSADIRIALDMFELALKNQKIREFILFSSDSDFIPVIQKLSERKKEVAVIVDQAREGIYSAYRYQADTLIPLANLLGAVVYERPKRNFLGFKTKRPQRSSDVDPIQEASTAKPQSTQSTKKENLTKKNATTKVLQSQSRLIDLAATRVVRLAAQTPTSYVGQKRIEDQLKSISGFSKTAANRYFGTDSYQALMKEIEKRTGRITVTPADGSGIRVKYRPKQE